MFATELVREAEISGRVGAETDRREESLIEKTGLEPDISWSQEGRIQLNKDVSVTLTYETKYRTVWKIWFVPGHIAGRGVREIGGVLEIKGGRKEKIRGLVCRTIECLKGKGGSGVPMAAAVTLALLVIFCGISEYFRLQIIAVGVRDALEDAIISVVK